MCLCQSNMSVSHEHGGVAALAAEVVREDNQQSAEAREQCWNVLLIPRFLWRQKFSSQFSVHRQIPRRLSEVLSFMWKALAAEAFYSKARVALLPNTFRLFLSIAPSDVIFKPRCVAYCLPQQQYPDTEHNELTKWHCGLSQFERLYTHHTFHVLFSFWLKCESRSWELGHFSQSAQLSVSSSPKPRAKFDSDKWITAPHTHSSLWGIFTFSSPRSSRSNSLHAFQWVWQACVNVQQPTFKAPRQKP